MSIEDRLVELGIELPEAPTPMANYVPYTVTGDLVFVSGQTPERDGTIVAGTLGADMSIEEGAAAARICGLFLLAQAKNACGGDLSRLSRCLKLGGFVVSAPDFFDQPKVINGASDLMVEVLGESGRHARFAVGAPALPGGAAVEVEAVFQIA